MSINPMEYYQIPQSGKVATQTSEDINNTLNAIYDSTDIINFSNYIERKPQVNISECSEKIFTIQNNISEARKKYLDSYYFVQSETSFIKSSVKRLLKLRDTYSDKSLTQDDLIKRESIEVGSKLFGETMPNVHREFFMDDQNHWFFYQQTINSKNDVRSVTLHYEVMPDGVLCISSESGIKGELLTGEHLENFKLATRAYHDQAMEKIYNHKQHTGKKVA